MFAMLAHLSTKMMVMVLTRNVSCLSPGQPGVWSWHHVTPLTLSWLTTTAQGTQENNQQFLTIESYLQFLRKHFCQGRLSSNTVDVFISCDMVMFSESPLCPAWLVDPPDQSSWPDMTLANFCANCPGRRWEESRCSVPEPGSVSRNAGDDLLLKKSARKY